MSARTRHGARRACAMVGLLVVMYVFPASSLQSPGAWNTDLQADNNCYNYACDLPNGTFAQPGEAGGMPITGSSYTCENVTAGAIADGLTFAGETLEGSECPANCHRVFLAISADDYHWWREDAPNFWSHKPGSGIARNYDAVGRGITNPLTSDRDFADVGRSDMNYDTPCGFFCVCRDKLKDLDGNTDRMKKPIPTGWYDGSTCVPNMVGCLASGQPASSPRECCSCVLRITQPQPTCR